MGRSATVIRNTKETQIGLELNLDGTGEYEISTGIGFFDHMLEAFSRHSSIDMALQAKGDLFVDFHHTMEDTGIVIGTAIREALGDKAGIRRFGDAVIPMDDALCMCAIDLSGRAYLDFNVEFPTERVGAVDTELFKEFFLGLSSAGLMNVHFRLMAGSNSHHIAEAVYKSFARALRMAVSFDEKSFGRIPSTKGII